MTTQGNEALEVTAKKRGAPKGNRNAIRHGLRSSSLPPGCGWLEGDLRTFRRALEKAVVDRHGEIDVAAAAAISTAIRCEQVARLAMRWLAVEGDKLPPMEKLRFSGEAAKSSEARDRAIALLHLELTPAERAMRKMRNKQRPTQTPKADP